MVPSLNEKVIDPVKPTCLLQQQLPNLKLPKVFPELFPGVITSKSFSCNRSLSVNQSVSKGFEVQTDVSSIGWGYCKIIKIT